MTRSKVILVTYAFPPYARSLGGAVRILKLAEYLQAHSYDVSVVCAGTGQAPNSFGYDDLLATLDVIYVDDPFAKAGARVVLNEGTSGRSWVSGIRQAFKRVLLWLLTPDSAIVMKSRFQAAAISLIEDDNRTTVITSGPPHSVHLAGNAVKKRHPSVRWIVDYRDSWNGTSLFRKSGLLQKLNEHWERKMLRRCDRFVFVSTPMLRKSMVWGGNSLANKSELIRNGFDSRLQRDVVRTRSSIRPLRIGYFGAISDQNTSYRDPTEMLRVIGQMSENDIKIEFYGSIDLSPNWSVNLGIRLLIGPQLSHRDAIEKMSGMDALLLLHTRKDGADEVITGKVFEYIATGLPIISIGPQVTAVNELLSGDPSAFCVDFSDSEAISELFHTLVVMKSDETLPVRSADRIDGFSRDTQFTKFLPLIK